MDSDKLNNFVIIVNEQLCVPDGGNVSGQQMIVKDCDHPLRGHFVDVKLKGNDRVLSLCEIKVFEYNTEGKHH